MKHLTLIALLLLSSCSSTASGRRWWEADWEFDCEWARFWDFQNNARNRSMGIPFKSNFTAIYCEVDPTAIDSPLYGRKKSQNKK